jgi:hypothetical protein
MNRLNVVSDEVEQLIEGVRAVRGVESIENHLYVHTEPGNVSALQGNQAKPTGQPLDAFGDGARRRAPQGRRSAGRGDEVVAGWSG